MCSSDKPYDWTEDICANCHQFSCICKSIEEAEKEAMEDHCADCGKPLSRCYCSDETDGEGMTLILKVVREESKL